MFFLSAWASAWASANTACDSEIPFTVGKINNTESRTLSCVGHQYPIFSQDHVSFSSACVIVFIFPLSFPHLIFSHSLSANHCFLLFTQSLVFSHSISFTILSFLCFILYSQHRTNTAPVPSHAPVVPVRFM